MKEVTFSDMQFQKQKIWTRCKHQSCLHTVHVCWKLLYTLLELYNYSMKIINAHNLTRATWVTVICNFSWTITGWTRMLIIPRSPLLSCMNSLLRNNIAVCLSVKSKPKWNLQSFTPITDRSIFTTLCVFSKDVNATDKNNKYVNNP